MSEDSANPMRSPDARRRDEATRRRALALRENLKRRKAQARARSEQDRPDAAAPAPRTDDA